MQYSNYITSGIAPGQLKATVKKCLTPWLVLCPELSRQPSRLGNQY